MSELKLAYVQLQEAHIPYDPDKIKAADELVFSNLDGLCKVRRSFKEKQFQKSNSLSACLTVLRTETKVQTMGSNPIPTGSNPNPSVCVFNPQNRETEFRTQETEPAQKPNSLGSKTQKPTLAGWVRF